LAQLVFTPAILCWMDKGGEKLKALTPKERFEAIVILSVITVSASFASRLEPSFNILAQPLFFLPALFQFWMAIRFGMLGGSLAVSIWALLLAKAAVEGHGPFSGQTPAAMGAALGNYLLPRAIAQYLIALAIEQKARAQNLSRESEERFRILANSSPVLVWMTGTNKLCDFVNQGWLDFTGHSLKQEIGTTGIEGVHPDDVVRCLETYESAFEARKPFQMEYRMRRHDGQYRWIVDQGAPRYSPSGEFAGYVGSCVDITERKLADELRQTLAHLQRLSVLGELSAAIAHEIKQPLNAISLNTAAARKLLESPNPDLNEFREILGEIREDVQRTNDVVNRTRAMARKQDLTVAAIDIRDTISDVLRLLAHDAAHRNIRLRFDQGGALPPVLGDKTQLQQVLLNLVANAMEAYAEAGRDQGAIGTARPRCPD
jgi:PAS domain S-box-containing protein